MAVTLLVSTSDAGSTPNATGSFTPTVDDLLVVAAVSSASVTGAIEVPTASANGITFAAVGASCFYNSSGNSVDIWVANQLVPASPVAMTVTWAPADVATSTVIDVYAVTGMSKTGATAARQVDVTDNGGFGTAPTLTFPAACLTGNVTVLAAGNMTNPANLVPPTSWTEINDTGCTTPNAGLEVVYRLSGFTGTTVTWGGNSGTAWGAVGVELDTSTGGLARALDGKGTAAAIATGLLAVATALSAVGSAAADATGDLTVTGAGGVARALDGIGSAAASAAGSLDTARPVAGTGTSAASATGSADAARPMAGSASAASDLGGVLTTARLFTATGNAAASSTGDLTVTPAAGGPVSLDGSGNTAAASSGALTLERPITGTSSAASSSSGSLALTRPLAAIGATAASATGNLSIAGQAVLDGKANAAASAIGALQVARPFAGIGPAAAGSTGALDVTGLIPTQLDGKGSTAASATGVLATVRSFSGAAGTASNFGGLIQLTSSLTGTTAMAADFDGSLTIVSTNDGVPVENPGLLLVANSSLSLTSSTSRLELT